MIYLIRHGETARNKEKVLQGRIDVPLNDTGREQAAEVRDRFRAAGITFDKIYTSPLIRAIQTAEIVTEGMDAVPQIVDDRLIEMDYGPYEGMDLTHPAPELIAFFRDFVHTPAPEGMEPLPEVTARLGAFLSDIRAEAAGSNILISTHAIAMKGALEYLEPDAGGRWWSTFIRNCAVYTAETSPEEGWSVPVLY